MEDCVERDHIKISYAKEWFLGMPLFLSSVALTEFGSSLRSAETQEVLHVAIQNLLNEVL